jgi:hypothetical protein
MDQSTYRFGKCNKNYGDVLRKLATKKTIAIIE